MGLSGEVQGVNITCSVGMYGAISDSVVSPPVASFQGFVLY